jgi:CHAT domain-containing protein
MLREMGQYDRNQPLGLKELSNEAWKTTAAEILKHLTADAPAEAWDEFEELIIVPDGMLWYVPFEALQVQNGDERTAVIDKVKVRYAPTISLAAPDQRPRPRITRTAVVAGSLFPRDGEELSQELLADLQADDANVFGVSLKPPPISAVLAKTVGRLVVLNDINNVAKGPYQWTPMTIDRGKTAGSLAQWMQLPWGGPDEVLLPGFHTPAENGLKRAGTGEEIFLAVCGMMSTGSRTILLSRWRDGGRTCYDLLREFLRELPHRSASDAWQRSVRLASESDLVWSQEPRIKELPPDAPPLKAEHPFFWGGYMLIDTGVEPK